MQLLKVLLLIKGKQRIVVVNIPWYLGASGDLQGEPRQPEEVQDPEHATA